MIRLLIAGRRAAGITRAAAHAHMRTAHAPLVLDQPTAAGPPLARYVQNHVVDGVYFATEGDHAVERDLVTELCFESLEAMRTGLASNYYAQVLRPDERRFVHDASAAKMMVETNAVVTGANPAWKLFAMIGRAPDAADADWRSATTAVTGEIAGVPALAALAVHRVMPSPVGAPFTDVVFEAWFHTCEAARAAAAAVATLIRSGAPAIAPDRSLLLVAEQFDRDRLRALLDAGDDDG